MGKWVLTLITPSGQTRKNFNSKSKAERVGRNWREYRKAFNMKGRFKVESYEKFKKKKK